MKRIILFIILFSSYSALFSQSQLKTYRGSYPEMEITNYEEGTAQYTYSDNPQGGRIYQGPFELRWGWNNSYYLKGDFKDNKQDGQWKAKWDDGSPTTKTLTATFKEGKLDGPVAYSDVDAITPKNPVLSVTINCNMKEGKFDGPAKIKHLLDGVTTTLEGSFEDNMPIGFWTFTTPTEKTVYEFRLDDGKEYLYFKSRKEDPRTGDLLEEVSRIPVYNLTSIDPGADLPRGFDMINQVICALSDIVMRDSQKRERWYLELKPDPSSDWE